MRVTNNPLPEAYIAVGGNRQKIYSEGKVYLNGGTEFQLELFNPTQGTVAAKIYINDEPISNSLIVIRPGQREYLDRYIDNNSKFLFDTYTVEDSEEVKQAIANNGMVKVEFFKEKPVANNGTITIGGSGFNPFFGSGVSGGWSGASGTGDTYGTFYCNTSNLSSDVSFTASNVHDGQACMDWLEDAQASNQMETGRIEGGGASDQNFTNYYGEFETYSSVWYDYQILPASQQPVEINKIRRYCPSCRNRIRKSSWKFCPSCGEDLSDI